MARDEIMAMVPGQELDALIGKLVKATPRVEWWATMDEVTCYADFNSEQLANEWHEEFKTEWPNGEYARSGRIIRKEFYKHYSTDISAAFEVIEKMQQKGWYITIEHYLLNTKTICYRKLLDKSQDVGIFIKKMGDAEGICKAALLALEEKP